MSKQLILVVDMIEGFVNIGPLHSENIKQIVHIIPEYIKDYPQADICTIIDSHDVNCAEFKNFPEHCIEGSVESQLISELEYITDLPNYKWEVKKNSTNGIFRLFSTTTALEEYDEFIIMGCCTDICVLNLALSLKTMLNEMNKEASVKVIKNAVATYDTDDHPAEEYDNAAFKIMEINGVELV